MILEGFLPVSTMLDDPEACHVYALYWRLDIVYIGSTYSITGRLRQHAAKRRKDSSYCWDRALIKPYPTIVGARCEERRLINIYHPKYNEKARSIPGLPKLWDVLGIEPPEAEPMECVGLERRI